MPSLLGAMIASPELGMRLHRRLMAQSGKGGGDTGSDEGFVLSGVLGLLALLMGFSLNNPARSGQTWPSMRLRG